MHAEGMSVGKCPDRVDGAVDIATHLVRRVQAETMSTVIGNETSLCSLAVTTC